MTADEVAVRLRSAVRVAETLPAVGAFPSKGGRSCLNREATSSDIFLTPAQTSAALAVADWPSIIVDHRDRRLVRLRADGVTWRELGELSGLTAMGALKAHRRGCTAIARAINTGKLQAPATFHLAA